MNLRWMIYDIFMNLDCYTILSFNEIVCLSIVSDCGLYSE